MRGAVDLFTATIIVGIAIIAIYSILAIDDISRAVSAENCESQVRQKMSVWIEKMKLSTAREETAEVDDFLVDGACIEYVAHEGIKFRSDKEGDVSVFTTTDCDPDPSLGERSIRKCDKSEIVRFVFEDDSGVIRPSEVPLKVKIIPPNEIKFLGR